MTPSEAIKFLEEAAKYFEKRDTHCEDKSHWANVYNAENCRKVVTLIKDLQEILRRGIIQ
jgi:hypothetical protein